MNLFHLLIVKFSSSQKFLKLFRSHCFSSCLCSGLKENEADSDMSSDDADSPSRFEGAEFKSSLKNFELSENKRTRLRELEVSQSHGLSLILTQIHIAVKLDV